MMVRSDHGFTLLEIMLAMAVLGMVVSMVTLSLSSSLDVIESTRDQGDLYYRAEIALQRISEDLASAMLPEDVDFQGERKEIDGSRADKLHFASMAHIVFNPEHQQDGMGVIAYTIRADRENELELVLLRGDRLYRPQTEQNREDDTEEGFILCDRLRSVEFSFKDKEGEEHDSWNTFREEDEKDSKRRLPVAVSCSLEFWLDLEEETSITFSTSVLLPVGMIQAEAGEENNAQ
ncbi:MAG: prepilin-type N-terminal cleavage/methylation domain-containing protein [Desulfobulbaceae bacterium]|nr:prepilin-type N-terminal cleavage/methylation domain-containing protein [Desulfobulbaceae bacterium]